MMRPIIQLFSFLLGLYAYRFSQALKNPRRSQRSVQQEIYRNFLSSDYGKSLDLGAASQTSLNEQWNQIPVVNYEDIQDWIEPADSPGSQEFKNSSQNTPLPGKSLTPEPILFYEKTSGSRGPAKWIPYTQSLRSSFNAMFCVWVHDLIQNGPKFETGKFYFCISPQLKDPQIVTENAGGLADDSEYLDGWLRALLSLVLVAPPRLKHLQDPDEFKEQLSLELLCEDRLEAISIWSPSFLKVLLDYIETHRESLLEKLGDKISGDRSQLLKQSPIPWTQIWPKLKLISCWDSSHSREQSEFLRKLFPGVMVQGKGLLATEAPMTIPLIAAQGFVPLLNEVFFEFEDKTQKIYKLHEIKQGEEYTLIISQKGGLYRYRIGDRVRVSHFYHKTPCLEFLGRDRSISDLVGEKLSETFVKTVLEDISLETTFFKTLVPVTQPVAHYLLLLDEAQESPEAIAQKLDRALMRSPHYRHARLLGQLDRPRVFISKEIPHSLIRYRTQSGKKWGDLKHEILANAPIDSELLQELETLVQPNFIPEVPSNWQLCRSY
ncbi:GH3 auxin-responsive promoter family protein [Phormidium pseudopriestleyi FRX01]|uniref:GH3 auxin-responsive promoter family protein n=1 Tax=Phormidium pseudopriestleyi FRX01 TaxID=1759528 RepID=A0ABS3FNM5_9CYAN|nr:GH3 auxin-responsive promoter family protein [Phormidium pseudopriestleyi]MBO0348723.1 GH3 auxin-responsive promoter family protein [Phormidium pseudopriestleyi FRX01]